MALIEFQNLPNTTTPLNAENLNYNFDLMSNMMTITGTTTNITTTSSSGEYAKIPFNTKLASVGDKLTFDDTNDCIIIGEGVSYISISCGCSIYQTSSGMTYQSLCIFQNEYRRGVNSQVRISSTSNYAPTILSEILLPVQEGDKISAKIFNRLAGSLEVYNPYLTVKVIA